MASDAARLLDELMGRNRNVHPSEDAKNIEWSDKEVCKHFLCGYCPSELFTNTKADLGPCTDIHDEALRKDYQKSDRFEKVGYEERWIDVLERIVSDVDKKIKRGHARLSMTQDHSLSNVNSSGGPKSEQVEQLTNKIDDLVDQAEKLGCEGKVEEAQGVMKLCDQLRKERSALERPEPENGIHIPAVKRMEVCPICGAFLIAGDAESRQREHLMGKLHMGYAQMRTTVNEYNERKQQRIAAEKEEAERAREEERKQREERRRRDEERHRDRRDSRRRSRSRDRRRSRSRDRRRSRSRDRRRSRSRDRRGDRGGYRDRRPVRRSRSRDRPPRRRTRSRDRVRRSKSTERRRSRSRDQSRRNSKERRRTRSRSRDMRRSRSRGQDSRRRTRSRDRKQSQSTERESFERNGRSVEKETEEPEKPKFKPVGDAATDMDTNETERAETNGKSD